MSRKLCTFEHLNRRRRQGLFQDGRHRRLRKGGADALCAQTPTRLFGHSEAKGEGFDVKVLKEILRLRKQDQDERDEQESLLDLYLRAMESAGTSEAQAA